MPVTSKPANEQAMRLKNLIAAKGFSQSQFAKEIGISRVTLGNWLGKNPNGIRLDNLYRVAKGLGLSVDKLTEQLTTAH